MFQSDYHRINTDGQFSTLLQLANGKVDVSDDGNVVLMTAAGTPGSEVGKSAYTTSLNPTDSSGVITAEFDFMIPHGNPTSHIYLADLESANASIGKNPGVRIQVRDGLIRVERGKIGIKELWPSSQEELLQTGKWYSLRVEMRPGNDKTGEIKLYLDNELVVNEQGYTMIYPELVPGMNLSGGTIDRVQIGMTANVNDNIEAQLAVRNVEISVDSADNSKDGTYTLSPMKVEPFATGIYRAGTENNPVSADSVTPAKPAKPAAPETEKPAPQKPVPDAPSVETPDADQPANAGPIKFGNNAANAMKGSRGDDDMRALNGNDLVVGNQGNDALRGGLGQDTMIGGTGNDTLRGGTDADKLYGGSGRDLMGGGKGNDLIDGGAGNDMLTGGYGQDTFLFGAGSGQDVITDFNAGVDKLFLDFNANELRGFNATNTTAGVKLAVGTDTVLLEDVSLSDLSMNDLILA